MTLVYSLLILWVFVIAVYATYRTTLALTPVKYVERPLWEPVHVVQQFERYKPLQCHTSVIVSDSSLNCSKYGEEHLRWATESLVDKLLQYVRPHITIETRRDPRMYGTEIHASLNIYKREV